MAHDGVASVNVGEGAWPITSTRRTSQTRVAKVRQMGETSWVPVQRLVSEREYRSQARARETSTEMSQRLANLRQNMLEVCDSKSNSEC
ncbi:hypothetical protein EVAR_34171_1 [Eumeta japonica]|uniref:Uncharacterized protein n=1 Tax=Eumeta variegata TaxID=151549 RepID=A0A4C1WHZ1_EUMVA|nr:hypothetical protein EVAR_34171_1 [Eumeta japonica]